MTWMYVYMYCFLFSDEHVKSIMTTVKVYKKSNNIKQVYIWYEKEQNKK